MLVHQKYGHTKENSFKLFIGKNDLLNLNDDFIEFYSLRKVKLDQRKLTDNVNAVSDIARVRRNFWI
jgi:hypothetical protein